MCCALVVVPFKLEGIIKGFCFSFWIEFSSAPYTVANCYWTNLQRQLVVVDENRDENIEHTIKCRKWCITKK